MKLMINQIFFYNLQTLYRLSKIEREMNKFEKLAKLVKKGQIQKVSEMLQETTLNINDLDNKSGKTLIQIAMQNSDVDMFNILTSFPGVDFQMSSKEGEIPIETAIGLNDSYFVTKLLELGVNPRKKNQKGQTGLQIAIRNQTSKQILKKLVHYKFDINQKVEQYGSLLNLAIVEKQSENVLFLLESGVKITTTDSKDNTCLILAVINNCGASVLAILEHMAEGICELSNLQKQFFINAHNKDGNTALHIACSKNYQTIISLLEGKGKQFGIDLTLKNKKGQTSEDLKANVEKQRLLELENEKKRKQQKKIRSKQKEQEKYRQKLEEQARLQEQKRRRKQQEILLMKQEKYKNQTNKSKSLWMCGILMVLILGVMYLVILNAVQKKKMSEI